MKTDLQRFQEKTKTDSSGCRLWTGATRNGYGAFRFLGHVEYAHRVSWILNNGEIPHSLFVCHTCDVRACVNPLHLFLGSHKDNMHDASKKGRLKQPNGDRHRLAKLDRAKVAEIRNSDLTDSDVAAQYGISRSYAWKLRAGLFWKAAILALEG